MFLPKYDTTSHVILRATVTTIACKDYKSYIGTALTVDPDDFKMPLYIITGGIYNTDDVHRKPMRLGFWPDINIIKDIY